MGPAQAASLAAARRVFRDRFPDADAWRAHFADMARRSHEARRASAGERKTAQAKRKTAVPAGPTMLAPAVVVIVGRDIPLEVSLADVLAAASRRGGAA